MFRLVSVKSSPKYQAAVKAQQEKERRKMEPDEPAPIVSKYPVYIDEIKQIINEVASKHGLTREDIIGKSRKANIVAARHEAIEMVHMAKPKLTMKGIGRRFGDRDHTTIWHALKKRGVK